MAIGGDNVNIVGVGGKTPPMWATEKTQAELLDVMEKVLKSVDPKYKSKENKDKAKTESDYIKRLSEAAKSSKDYVEHSQKAGKTQEGISKASEVLKKSFEGTKKELLKNGGLLGNFNKGIKGLTNPVFLLSGLFGAAVEGIVMFKDIILESAEINRQLYDTGVTLQGGLFDLRLAAASATLSLGDFSQLVMESSRVVSSFGDDGVMVFANAIESVRKLTRAQSQYGLTTVELAGYTSDYLEILRVQGTLHQLERAQRNVQTQEFLRNITMYSQVLGVSRKEIVDSMKQSSEDTIIMAALNERGRKNLTDAMGSFKAIFDTAAPSLQESLKRIATQVDDFSNNDLLLALNQIGASDIVEQMRTFGNNIENMTADERHLHEMRLLQSFRNLSEEQKSAIRNRTQISDEMQGTFGEIANIMITSANISQEKLLRIQDRSLQEQDEASQKIQQLRIEFENAQAKLTEAFTQLGDTLLPIIIWITKTITNYVSNFSKLFESDGLLDFGKNFLNFTMSPLQAIGDDNKPVSVVMEEAGNKPAISTVQVGNSTVSGMNAARFGMNPMDTGIRAQPQPQQNNNKKTAEEAVIKSQATSQDNSMATSMNKIVENLEKNARIQEETNDRLAGIAHYSKESVETQKRTYSATKSNKPTI